jgi:hypothetical protein
MTTDVHASPESLAPGEDDDEWLRESLAPKRRWPRLTMALAATAVAAIAFMAGVLIEKNYFASSGSSSAAAGGAAGRFAGLFGRGAAGAGATGASGALAAGVTIGQVKVINGKTFYVTDSSGNTVKVAVTASSRLTAQKQVKIQDLHPGDTVTVRWVAGAGGTIQATTVAIGTAGGGFGGFGQGGGAGASGSSAAGSG